MAQELQLDSDVPTEFLVLDSDTPTEYLLLEPEAAGGLDIAIAAYHYNHNVGSNL